jgi:hypothetical protein
MNEQVRFETQRTKLLGQYAALNQKFLANTRPYKSTLPIRWDVVTALPVPAVAFAVARKGQELRFFGYGTGDQIPDGFGGTRKSTDADTNISKAKSTNGAEDFIIEGFAFGAKGVRVRNSALLTQITAAAAAVTPTPATVDPAITEALSTGFVYIGADTLAVMTPPQVLSSINLESALLQAVLASCTLDLMWDDKRIEKISTLDIVPEGGARSYLRSNGSPEASNRYRIPEGYLWRRDGQPDSDFAAVVTLREDVIVPLLVPTGSLGETPAFPSVIALDVSLRAHGLACSLLSGN